MVVNFAESQCQIAPIDVVTSCFNVISIVIAGSDHVSKGPWNLLFSAVKSSFRFPNVNIIVQLRMEVYRKPANRHRTATPFLKPSRQRYNKGLVTIFNRLCRLSSTKVGFAKECDKLHTIFLKWPIVVSQIRLHKSKQKPFVICCAEGIVPRFGQDGFQLKSLQNCRRVKLAAPGERSLESCTLRCC